MYAFAFGGTVWMLPVNPESLEVTYPARTNVTNTQRGAYVDHFGQGVGDIQISATTGWGKGERARIRDGIASMNLLKTLYQRYLADAASAPDPSDVPMTFTDGYTGEAFLVVPAAGGLRISQHKASPLLRRFTLPLTIVRELTGGRITDPSGITEAATSDLLANQGLASGAERYAQTASDAASIDILLGTASSYAVQAGDTLASIASLFDTTSDTVRTANGIRYPSRIQPGLVLTIPPS